jgi:hypothetical protein
MRRSKKALKMTAREKAWREQAARIGCENIQFQQSEKCAYPYCVEERKRDLERNGPDYKVIKTPDCMLSWGPPAGACKDLKR